MAPGAMSAVLVTASHGSQQPWLQAGTLSISGWSCGQPSPAHGFTLPTMSPRAAPAPPPSLKIFPAETSPSSAPRDGAGCVGTHRGLAQPCKRGIALVGAELPQELPTLRAGGHGGTAVEGAERCGQS